MFLGQRGKWLSWIIHAIKDAINKRGTLPGIKVKGQRYLRLWCENVSDDILWDAKNNTNKACNYDCNEKNHLNIKITGKTQKNKEHKGVQLYSLYIVVVKNVL